MNWKRGFKRLTHILAIFAGILGVPVGLVITDEILPVQMQPVWKGVLMG